VRLRQGIASGKSLPYRCFLVLGKQCARKIGDCFETSPGSCVIRQNQFAAHITGKFQTGEPANDSYRLVMISSTVAAIMIGRYNAAISP